MHIFSFLCLPSIKKESPYTFRGKENIIENVCVFFWSSKLTITKLTHRCLKQALPMTLSWWLFFVFRKWLTTGYWKKCICLDIPFPRDILAVPFNAFSQLSSVFTL
jgi:hypothetical protein